MTWEDRIELNPLVLAGKPVVKGTRIAVEFVIDLLADGWSEQDIRENYGLTHEDIQACLRYASARLHADESTHSTGDARGRCRVTQLPH